LLIISIYSDVVKKLLGKGTFAKVFKCSDLKHKDKVALKVIRRISRYVDSARIEADILRDIFDKQRSKNVDLCVELYSTFQYDGTCS
jgi:serine/threonine protein kinase